MPSSATTDRRYWAHYDGLQDAKHSILVRYLGGWFPILSRRRGRVLYIDCHAGRGRHHTGHPGSPILALESLLGHALRDRILSATEVHFVFFETSPEHYDTLLAEIDALGALPTNIRVRPYCEDYEAALRGICEDLSNRGQTLAPAFAFLDPYGFKLSMDLLNTLLAFPRCELLINFMYKYVDMAIHNPQQDANMDRLFGCADWRGVQAIEPAAERARRTINLFSDRLEARHVTHMYMRGTDNRLKYVLLHASNHVRGRELMKEAIWAVQPSGTFSAHERAHPDQQVLVWPEPDLTPLRDKIWARFAGREVQSRVMERWLRDGLYLPKHLHEILRDYRNRSVVQAGGYVGRFAFSKNPVWTFPSERPADA